MSNGSAVSGTSEIVFAILFLSLAVFLLVMTSQLEQHEQAGLSIRTFPAFVGAGMAVLSLLLLARGIKTKRAESHQGGGKAVRERAGLREFVTRPFVVRFVIFALLGFVYTRVIGSVGYIVATPPLVFGAMLLYGEKKWYRLILIPIVAAFALYHLFRTFFRVPLPTTGLW